MSPDLERLIELQQLESTIADARATIAAHPQRLADADARLERSRAARVEAAKERLKDNQEARRALEKDVAVYQGRLTKFKDQLVGRQDQPRIPGDAARDRDRAEAISARSRRRCSSA